MGQPSDPRGRWILCLIAAIAIFAIAFVMRTAYCVDYDYVSGADGQCRDNLSTESIFFMLAGSILAIYSVYRITRRKL
ncbi:hypothetical protein [Arthrobacter sp. NPDC092385]|uniref:hypothetical protein n=1 Tax=Arthrobacter sp. NPDC092385 TaxID=3363943 RepID=UPI0037F7A988